MRARLRDPVSWVVGVFLLNCTLQRFSVPGIDIPLTLPLSLGVLGLAVMLGALRVHPRRMQLWLVAASLSAAVVIPQAFLLTRPFVSPNSWALWVAVWLPLVVQVPGASWSSYRRCLRGFAAVGVGMSLLSLLFIGLQLGGVPYVDWFGDLVPQNLQVHGYVVSYPLYYGSPLYKSNAWITLEPSFLSFVLGLSLCSALAAKMGRVVVLVLLAGLLSTTAGSGLAVVGVYVVALLVSGKGAVLRRHVLPALAVLVAFGSTFLGASVSERLTEVTSSNSSTSLRGIQPYIYLFPQWVQDPVAVVFGAGAGASADLVNGSGVLGLIVTTVSKVLFDYGLIGGAGLLALLVTTYLRPPDRAIAAALGSSMFLLQPASPPLLLCSFLAVSLWTSRSPLEQQRAKAQVDPRRTVKVAERGFVRTS